MTHRNPDPRTPGTTTAPREHEPALPHEQDESSRGHAGTTPQQKELGRQAYGNATDGTGAAPAAAHFRAYGKSGAWGRPEGADHSGSPA